MLVNYFSVSLLGFAMTHFCLMRRNTIQLLIWEFVKSTLNLNAQGITCISPNMRVRT